MLNTSGIKAIKRGPMADGVYALAVCELSTGHANTGTVYVRLDCTYVDQPDRHINTSWWMTEKALPFCLGDVNTICDTEFVLKSGDIKEETLAKQIIKHITDHAKSTFKVRIERRMDEVAGRSYPTIVNFVG